MEILSRFGFAVSALAAVSCSVDAFTCPSQSHGQNAMVSCRFPCYKKLLKDLVGAGNCRLPVFFVIKEYSCYYSSNDQNKIWTGKYFRDCITRIAPGKFDEASFRPHEFANESRNGVHHRILTAKFAIFTTGKHILLCPSLQLAQI